MTKKLILQKFILELVDQYLNFIKKAKELDLFIASDYSDGSRFGIYKIENVTSWSKWDSENSPQLPEILEFKLKRLNAMRKCADSFLKENC